jgi:hypothetical protein
MVSREVKVLDKPISHREGTSEQVVSYCAEDRSFAGAKADHRV